MEYCDFKYGSEKVSLLGLGCMRLPRLHPEKDDIDYPKAQEMVDAAILGGVNYFDTAYFYHGGGSETFLGEALAKYPRHQYYLADKMPLHMLEKEGDVPRIFAEQLARCKTGYFDFYLCHALSGDNYHKLEDYKVYSFLQQQKREGRIRHIGFSFHDEPEVLAKACRQYEWEFAQIQLNPLDWEVYRSREQYEVLAQRGIPCIVMEPVRGGRLADLGADANALLQAAAPGRSIASWSLRFAAGLPGVMTVLSGMSDMAQLKDNISIVSPLQPLSEEEQISLFEALNIFKARHTVGCTACRYCMPCPAGIPIPEIFEMYNKAILSGGMAGPKNFRKKYDALPADAKAGGCIRCGRCEEACPQKLAIPDLLAVLDTGEGTLL